jgi:hypothetical protein
MRLIRDVSVTFLALALGLIAGVYSKSGRMEEPSRTNPKDGVEKGLKMPRKTSEPRVMKGQEDPETTFTALLTAIHHPDERFRGRIELCRALEAIEPSQIRELLLRAQKLPLRYRKDLSAAVLERWFEADKIGAEQWLRANASHSDQLVKIWARFAPEAALRELMASPHGNPGASSIALDQIAGKDPKARLTALASFPPGKTGIEQP